MLLVNTPHHAFEWQGRHLREEEARNAISHSLNPMLLRAKTRRRGKGSNGIKKMKDHAPWKNSRRLGVGHGEVDDGEMQEASLP